MKVRLMKLLTLEINMVGTSKKLSRKIQITDDYNLNCLHIAIVEMFYLNYESDYEFEYLEKVYLPGAEHDLVELTNISTELTNEMEQLKSKDVDLENLNNTSKIYLDDCSTRLCDLNLKTNAIFEYTNDQELLYEFTLKVVATNPASVSKIKIVEFKGKFVPYGLDVEMYNNILTDKAHPDYSQLIELLASFDGKIVSGNVHSLLPDSTMYN